MRLDDARALKQQLKSLLSDFATAAQAESTWRVDVADVRGFMQKEELAPKIPTEVKARDEDDALRKIVSIIESLSGFPFIMSSAAPDRSTGRWELSFGEQTYHYIMLVVSVGLVQRLNELSADEQRLGLCNHCGEVSTEAGEAYCDHCKRMLGQDDGY